MFDVRNVTCDTWYRIKDIDIRVIVKMGKIFCLIGKSATGKDTIYNRILEDKDIVINTDCIGHSMYYKVISNINKINSFRFFSGSGNVELSIRKLYKLVRE